MKLRLAPLRVAIVGYGVVGPMHALAYSVLARLFPDVPRMPEVALIVETSASSLSRARSDWPVPAHRPDPELLDKFCIDIVDCCVPTDLHAQVCRSALAAGLSVLCEKPLTGNSESSASLVSQAANARAMLGINFNFRFVPALREAKRLISDGALGEIRSLRVDYHRSSNLARHKAGTAPTDVSRGALFDLGPHAVNLVHFLFGKITSVAARTHSYGARRTKVVDDIAKLEVTLEGGALGSIEVSKITPGAANDLEIFAYGTEASVRFSIRDPDTLDLFRGVHYATAHQRLRFGSGALAEATATLPAESGSSVLLWHAASIAAFARAMAGQDVSIATGTDGVGVDLVLEAAQTSAAYSSAWVSVGAW